MHASSGASNVNSPLFNRRAAACLLASLAIPFAAQAQTYPARTVKIVVPYPPGSSPDALARLLADELGRQIKQTVLVENKPGASGMLGASAVANAAPDGNTLLMYTPAWSAAKIFMKKPLVSVPDGLEPVTLVAEGRFAFVAAGGLPAKTFAEMVAYAKAHPSRLNFATTGGGDSLLYFHSMLKEKGIRIEPIQYKGSAEYVSALVANEVQLAFAPEYTMLPLVKEGKLKILAVTGDTRSKAYPDAPLFSELGLPQIRNNWMALFAPKGTSPALVTKLNADLTAIIRLPDVDKRIRDIYFEPVGSTADQLRRRVDMEISEWTAVAKAAGIEPQ
jgi:tripartite-type tricarboxylate transporter receptor subunit TctC